MKTHKAQCVIGLQSHIFLSMFQRMMVKYRLTSHTVYTAGSWIDSVTYIQELCESLLVAQFVLKHLQSVSESDGAHYTHTFSYTLFCSFIFFCHSPLLWLVARKQYQISAGSYLVTLLISCGPALPCGCCSRDDGDEEKGGGGGGGG